MRNEFPCSRVEVLHPLSLWAEGPFSMQGHSGPHWDDPRQKANRAVSMVRLRSDAEHHVLASPRGVIDLCSLPEA
jgi:hypothetical protein